MACNSGSNFQSILTLGYSGLGSRKQCTKPPMERRSVKRSAGSKGRISVAARSLGKSAWHCCMGLGRSSLSAALGVSSRWVHLAVIASNAFCKVPNICGFWFQEPYRYNGFWSQKPQIFGTWNLSAADMQMFVCCFWCFFATPCKCKVHGRRMKRMMNSYQTQSHLCFWGSCLKHRKTLSLCVCV